MDATIPQCEWTLKQHQLYSFSPDWNETPNGLFSPKKKHYVPNKIKNEPPITGSGTVTKRAPNLLNTPSAIINIADIWTTRRLPTCTQTVQNVKKISTNSINSQVNVALKVAKVIFKLRLMHMQHLDSENKDTFTSHGGVMQPIIHL